MKNVFAFFEISLARLVGHRPITYLIAIGVVGACVLGLCLQAMNQLEHGSIALLSMGSLGRDSEGLSGLGNEVQDDLNKNLDLQSQLSSEIGAKTKGCHCDCTQSPNEMKVKAATMLDQVGEVTVLHKQAIAPTSLHFCFIIRIRSHTKTRSLFHDWFDFPTLFLCKAHQSRHVNI